MPGWQYFERGDPGLASFFRKLIPSSGIVFLASIRKDGSPRLHPLCPVIADGRLLITVLSRSPKKYDLRRDPRVVLHTLPGPGHEELWIEGDAVEQSPEQIARWRSASPPVLRAPEGDAVFEIDISAVHGTIYQPGAGGLPEPRRRHWTPSGTDAAAAEPQ